MDKDQRPRDNAGALNRVVEVDDDYTMSVDDELVKVTCNDGVDVAITLPSVTDARGREYAIVAMTTADNGVDVASGGDVLAVQAIAVELLSQAGNYVVLKSNGLFWYQVAVLNTSPS